MRRELLCAILWTTGALAAGPLEKNHPLVEEGTKLYEAGNYEQALEKFDAAAHDRSTDPRAHYNRGLALHKLGRWPEARQALTRAGELDRTNELTSKIHYNLGNVAAAEQARDEAIREYRKALRADPKDTHARHNLEVLLRNLPPPPPDGGSPDGGPPDAGPDGGQRDGGADAGRPPDGGSDGGADGGDAGPGDGGAGDGGAADGGTGDGGAGDGGRSNGPGETDGGAAEDAGSSAAEGTEATEDGGVLSKKEAEKLLDALKGNEKNLQLWRFKQKAPRPDDKRKDW